MSTVKSAAGSRIARRTRTESVDVVVTNKGGRDMAEAAYRGGALIGIESSEGRPPSDIPVEFVDWPFTKDGSMDEKWDEHLRVVSRERPKIAVAPDINEDNSYGEVIPKADELAEYADTVVVVPKAVKPSRVPDRFRVGLPAQDRFGGVPHNVWEYRNCRSVHILGGSPNRQFELSHYVAVDSIDSASPLKAAKFGNIWMGKWSEEGYNYYDRIERSMNNLLKEWNEDERVDEAYLNLVRLEVPPPEPAPFYTTEEKTKPPSRENLCLRTDEDPPFPGRAYFYREDTLSYQEYQDTI